MQGCLYIVHNLGIYSQKYANQLPHFALAPAEQDKYIKCALVFPNCLKIPKVTEDYMLL